MWFAAVSVSFVLGWCAFSARSLSKFLNWVIRNISILLILQQNASDQTNSIHQERSKFKFKLNISLRVYARTNMEIEVESTYQISSTLFLRPKWLIAILNYQPITSSWTSIFIRSIKINLQICRAVKSEVAGVRVYKPWNHIHPKLTPTQIRVLYKFNWPSVVVNLSNVGYAAGPTHQLRLY